MRIELHHFHNDPTAERKLDQILCALENLGRTIMSAISDFAAQQTAFNTEVSADLDAIQQAIVALNAQIATLQNSLGTISPEDQATLDALQASGLTLQSKADALAGKTPPTPPAG